MSGTDTIVQVYKKEAIPVSGINVKALTPNDFELVQVQLQNDCVYLVFHRFADDFDDEE